MLAKETESNHVVKADMAVCTVVYDRVRDTIERAWANGASAIA